MHCQQIAASYSGITRPRRTSANGSGIASQRSAASVA
jgi:hypothetical protein